jgi:hypothetical protein
VTCTADALTVRIKMEQPFQGLLYSRGFPLECRGQGKGDNDVTLHLPATRCGVRLLPTKVSLRLSPGAVQSASGVGPHCAHFLSGSLDIFVWPGAVQSSSGALPQCAYFLSGSLDIFVRYGVTCLHLPPV